MTEQESKNIKGVNKIGVREEYTAGGPTNAKLHAPARGPRSGSMVVANTASKNGGPVGPTNRKRTQPASSSFPPITQWADRRPQKISRTARRTNNVPVVPSNDDIPSLDSGTKNGSGFTKRVPVNYPSSTSSEIKELGDTKFRQNVQKVSNLVPPTRKKKLVNGNDRKMGRGVATARFSAPVEIPKQLSTAKLSLDKPKSVRTRPHTRRPSDRNSNSRPKPSSVLLPFWNQIEPHFSFPSDTDISYLKQQGSMHSVVPTTKPDVDRSGYIPLCQRLLSALMTEEGDDNENDDTESNGYASAFEDETDGVSDYHTMSMDNRLLLELQSIGLCPELMPAVQKLDDDIDGLISDLGNKYHEQVSRKTSVLDKLLKTTTEAKALQEKESKQDSVDEHTVLAYQKYMSCYGPNAPRGRSAGTKLAKKEALANVKQTLERCQEFETSFKDNVEDEPPLHFSHLEIPEMDVLGDAFSEQSLDLGSWLNTIDDIIIQDDEFMGLEIPMDDLSDIKMTV
ncbi:zinc finger, CCHC-type containing protein [Tanacetum coccineum]|uniref:Zinc finger, CCHC-type containing protein n=1 Tax=Tanacetum coccineum TaxID=301880 RepID=A0ABQ5IFZ5_9ASTR